MTEATIFRAYGENAATFLLFQALALRERALADVFLPNLKSFGEGQPRGNVDSGPVEVWLFPSFGKRAGFGEPDVLLLAGTHVFWIEAETTINCKDGVPALRRALTQLWRFRLFEDALKKKVETHRKSRRIVGVTLNGAQVERRAELRLKGHGVLQAMRQRLADADSHSYVLFTVDQPQGEGAGGREYAQCLSDELKQLSTGYRAELPRLSPDQCWYAYWNGDIEPKFNELHDNKLDLDKTYVRIKRSH